MGLDDVGLAIGDPAPDFTLEATGEQTISLSSYHDKNNVVLIFYPRNNTPGWNRQLSAARDAVQDYENRDTVVVAVNPATIKSHERYTEKFEFNFPICSDREREVAANYGALKANGKSIQRTVVIVAKDGIIRYYKQGLPPTEELLQAIDDFGVSQ